MKEYKKFKILERINSPHDLKKLSMEELNILTKELREYIIDVISKNGGHLAPSLGVVELTVALCTALDLPEDKVIWDVGHQSYAYKILTGRREEFKTIRKYGGISGFPRMEESEFDFFGTGHSSTSISAAIGIHEAERKGGRKGKIFAVIGDGAIGAGIAFEGLNYAGGTRKDIVVILNDNEFSISPTVGALSSFLGKKMVGPGFTAFRALVKKILGKIPFIGSSLVKIVRKIEEGMISLFTPGILFEGLGFHYVGPIDGHSVKHMVSIFKNVKQWDRPVLIHLLTKKGKGYPPAEKEPEIFHGVPPFDKETGKIPEKGKSFSSLFGEVLVRLAEKDERIVAITAAMKKGTGLDLFAEKFPDRFYDVGIAEPHAVTFAAGMASRGLKPVVAIYSTFLQRAFDQIIHDVALQNLHVVFAIDRAGIVGEDGPTHHGLFDLSYLRAVPGMTIMAPSDGDELADMLLTALNACRGPVAIRYPRGNVENEQMREPEILPVGKWRVVYEGGKDLLILSVGRCVKDAVKAADLLKREGIGSTVVNALFVKPVDEEFFEKMREFKGVLTVEENTVEGGFGSGVLKSATERGIMVPFLIHGIKDEFIPHGSVDELKRICKIDAEGIKEVALNFLKRL
jgi:1-deoxy-D-xylulose-5-phosphate synthase